MLNQYSLIEKTSSEQRGLVLKMTLSSL